MIVRHFVCPSSILSKLSIIFNLNVLHSISPFCTQFHFFELVKLHCSLIWDYLTCSQPIRLQKLLLVYYYNNNYNNNNNNKTEENYIKTICISLHLNQTKNDRNVTENSLRLIIIPVKAKKCRDLEVGKRPKSQRLTVFKFNNYSR